MHALGRKTVQEADVSWSRSSCCVQKNCPLKFIIAHCGAFHSFTRLSSPNAPPPVLLLLPHLFPLPLRVFRRGVPCPWSPHTLRVHVKSPPDEPADRFLREDSKLQFVHLSDVHVFFFFFPSLCVVSAVGSSCCPTDTAPQPESRLTLRLQTLYISPHCMQNTRQSMSGAGHCGTPSFTPWSPLV